VTSSRSIYPFPFRSLSAATRGGWCDADIDAARAFTASFGSLDRPTLQESTGVPVCVTDERKVQVGQDESHVVDRSYETWNSGNVDGLQELYAIDADVAIPGASAQGREQIGALWGAFISAFPDGQLTELLRLDCGGYIVSENNLSGTHTAPLVTPQGEIPATGNSVSVDGVSIFKIENGEIQSEHLYFDQMTFLAQLGLTPPQPTT
jgi:steroid delta-isomerase-like uncharacterized protein